MSLPLCVFCNRELPPSVLQGDRESVCPACRRSSSVLVFPAILEGARQPSPPALNALEEGAAPCFYSPFRSASKECSHCGVLISEPWAAKWGETTVCLKCLEHLRSVGKEARFQEKILLWDSLALRLALVPFTIFLWWTVFFSAPAVLFIAVWRWNSPRSMTSPGRAKMGIAAALAILQIMGVIGSFIAYSNGWFKQ